MVYSIELLRMWKDPKGIHVAVSLNKGDYSFVYSLKFKGSPEDVFYGSIIEDYKRDVIFTLDIDSIRVKKGRKKESVINYLKQGGEDFFKCFKFLHLLKKNGKIEMVK